MSLRKLLLISSIMAMPTMAPALAQNSDFFADVASIFAPERNELNQIRDLEKQRNLVEARAVTTGAEAAAKAQRIEMIDARILALKQQRFQRLRAEAQAKAAAEESKLLATLGDILETGEDPGAPLSAIPVEVMFGCSTPTTGVCAKYIN